MTTIAWQRVESVVIAVGVLAASVHWGFGWWWLLVLFLVFDLSMVGYLRDSRLGAHVYNAVHHYTGPVVLALVAVGADQRWAAIAALAWAFHVAVDRALGYGLKHRDHFEHTHLGYIGGTRRAARAAAHGGEDEPR